MRYRAAWVLPISRPPIRDGCVETANGRISAVGRLSTAGAVDLGSAAILPGLVNAHTHLELSYLGGAVPPAEGFVTWIRGVMAARRRRPDPAAPEIIEAVKRGIQESLDSGTALVGDISNTLVTYDLLAGSPLRGVVFYELIRFSSRDADAYVSDAATRIAALTPHPHVRATLAAHAPYSVAGTVLCAIRRFLDAHPDLRCSVHLAEAREELEFLQNARGPWRELLGELGSWDETFQPPGVGPVEYLERHGLIDQRVLAVHGVQMSAADLARLAARGATLVTCPRSNRHTGAGVPPIERFYASGTPIAIGTDSLASAPDLSIFEELSAVRAAAPGVPAATLLASATIQGARALGFDHDYGTIDEGKRARLLAVDVPDRIVNVEEYLLSGIRPEQIRWLE